MQSREPGRGGGGGGEHDSTCALCLHSLTRSPTGGAYSYTSRENVMPEVLEFTVIDIMHAKIFKKKQI